MGLRLIIEDYEGSTTVFPLGEGPVTIGREESNTICLTEKNVSRQHARLTPDPSGWKVEDLESYNGVRVNGSVVADAHVIHEGDLIQIGDYQLLIGDDTSTRATVDLGPSLLAAANEGGAASLPVAAAKREAMAAAARVVQDTPAVAPAAVTDQDYDDFEASSGGGGKGLIVVALLAAIGGGGWYFTAGPGANKPAPAAAAAKKAEPKAEAPAPEPAPEEPAAEAESGVPDAEAEPAADPAVAPEDEAAPAEPNDAEAEAEPAAEEPPDEDMDAAAEEADPAPTLTKKKKKKKKAAAPTSDAGAASSPEPAPAPSGKSAAELLADARKAQLGGSYSQAYSLAKKSYAASASPDAAQVMGVAACKMGDAAKAKSAYGKLSGSKKSALKSICEKSGIEL